MTTKNEILEYLDNVLHPLVSPEHWNVYSELHDMAEDLPEPVKHGHWVYKDGEMGFGIGAWCCSECGETNESLPFHKCKDPYAYAASKYCACCGARMDKDD